MDNNSQILSKKIDPYAKCISIEEKYVDDDHAQKESLQHSQSYFHHINDCIQLRSLIWNKDLFKNNRQKSTVFFYSL